MVSPLVIGASKDRIWVRHHSAGLAVECCLAYHASRSALAFLPLEGLLDIEGDDDAPVLLDSQATGKTLTCWSVEGIAQSRESWLPSLAELTPFPRLPGAFPRVPSRFSGALYEADALVEEAARRGVPHGARLQGSAGEIVACLDGQDRQTLHRLLRGRDPRGGPVVLDAGPNRGIRIQFPHDGTGRHPPLLLLRRLKCTGPSPRIVSRSASLEHPLRLWITVLEIEFQPEGGHIVARAPYRTLTWPSLANPAPADGRQAGS